MSAIPEPASVYLLSRNGERYFAGSLAHGEKREFVINIAVPEQGAPLLVAIAIGVLIHFSRAIDTYGPSRC